MTNEIIRLTNVSYTKNMKNILYIDELSFDKGEIYGLIGPNGAGKSTLIKIAALLDTPNNGVVNFDNQTINSNIPLELRRKISVVFQQPLMLSDNVFNNVAISLKLRKLPKNIIKEKTTFWMQQFGIIHLANRNAKNLSGGEAQRVSLARAFVTDPEIIFLDEPFSALDLPTKRTLLKDIKKVLNETKITTILVSHDYNEIKYLCNKVVLLIDGQVELVTDVDLLGETNFSSKVEAFMNEWMVPL
jgi:tungstate transport system ATP-binding protein